MIALAIAVSALAVDFPQASIAESNGRVTHASAFAAKGFGSTPETAAVAFLTHYAASFGISNQQKLVALNGGSAVHVQREIDGLPVFGGDLIVGIGTDNTIIQVNATEVPVESAGHFRISSASARRVATKAMGRPSAGDSKAARGWRSNGHVLRPVWRVDLIAAHPTDELRYFVDAETGRVLSRIKLRAGNAR